MASEMSKRSHSQATLRARQLRRVMTPPERKLWSKLRGRQLDGFKFRRQHPLLGYVLDFYCAERKLAVELDGPSHAGSIEYDEVRTERLAAEDIRVVRYTNLEIEENVDGVLTDILEQCRKSKPVRDF